MNNFLFNTSLLLLLISSTAFIIGLLMLFNKNDRKTGIKLLLYSTICFVIGFGTCVSTA